MSKTVSTPIEKAKNVLILYPDSIIENCALYGLDIYLIDGAALPMSNVLVNCGITSISQKEADKLWTS